MFNSVLFYPFYEKFASDSDILKIVTRGVKESLNLNDLIPNVPCL